MAEALLIFLESKTELQDPFYLIFHDLTNMNLGERKGREPWPIPNRWTPCFPPAHSGMLEIHVPSSSVLTNGRIYWKGIKERLQSECPNHGLRNGSGCVWSCTTHQFHCWPCRHLLGVVRIWGWLRMWLWLPAAPLPADTSLSLLPSAAPGDHSH